MIQIFKQREWESGKEEDLSYYVKRKDPRLGFRAFQEVFGVDAIPLAISVFEGQGLAVPDFLIEGDAVAIKYSVLYEKKDLLKRSLIKEGLQYD